MTTIWSCVPGPKIHYEYVYNKWREFSWKSNTIRVTICIIIVLGLSEFNRYRRFGDVFNHRSDDVFNYRSEDVFNNRSAFKWKTNRAHHLHSVTHNPGSDCNHVFICLHQGKLTFAQRAVHIQQAVICVVFWTGYSPGSSWFGTILKSSDSITSCFSKKCDGKLYSMIADTIFGFSNSPFEIVGSSRLAV